MSEEGINPYTKILLEYIGAEEVIQNALCTLALETWEMVYPKGQEDGKAWDDPEKVDDFLTEHLADAIWDLFLGNIEESNTLLRVQLFHDLLMRVAEEEIEWDTVAEEVWNHVVERSVLEELR